MMPSVLPALTSLGSLGLTGGPAGPSSAGSSSGGDFNFKGQPEWLQLAAAFAAGFALAWVLK